MISYWHGNVHGAKPGGSQKRASIAPSYNEDGEEEKEIFLQVELWLAAVLLRV